MLTERLRSPIDSNIANPLLLQFGTTDVLLTEMTEHAYCFNVHRDENGRVLSVPYRSKRRCSKTVHYKMIEPKRAVWNKSVNVYFTHSTVHLKDENLW